MCLCSGVLFLKDASDITFFGFQIFCFSSCHLVMLAEWVEISPRTSGISYLMQAVRSQQSHCACKWNKVIKIKKLIHSSQ